MLGVKCDNRESVHGPKKVALMPNIGLEMEMSDAILDVLLDNPNPLRRVSQRKLTRTNFDN
jgi:hypothetical protein